MKLIISMIVLLTLNACAKEKKFLSVSEAMHYYKKGVMLECGKSEIVLVTSRFDALKIGKDIMFQPMLPINGEFPTAFADACVLHK